MDRNEKALFHINKEGLGVEIGPCQSPIAPKRDGYQVDVIDHMSREELLAKYKDHHLANLENIEDVDFVCHGESYAELTGRSKYYDWVIAAHVIEHMPDIVGFIRNCDAILKEDGVLSLIIPDKRYCFDHFQPISSISKAIDAYYQGYKVHTPGAVAEHFLNIVSKGGITSWDALRMGEYEFVHPLELSQKLMDHVVRTNEYLDVHAWYFTPGSFRLMMHDLHYYGLIPLREVGFFPTAGTEFWVALGRQGQGMGCSRMEAMKMIDRELEEGMQEPRPPVEPPPPSLSRRIARRLKRMLSPVAR
ncbi:MAG: methyltransferase [Anaerolineales bacterium]|nr:methyltransferase [Anaerolineales bacterium]